MVKYSRNIYIKFSTILVFTTKYNVDVYYFFMEPQRDPHNSFLLDWKELDISF